MDTLCYDSSLGTNELSLQSGVKNGITPTMVHFPQEAIFVSVDALGHIEFINREEQCVGVLDRPAAGSPDWYGHTGQYGEMILGAEKGIIRLRLPVYRWIDHYPNCDGEYDRWTRRVDRWIAVQFDCKDHRITVTDWEDSSAKQTD